MIHTRIKEEKEFLVCISLMLQWADHFLFLCAQIRGQGSGLDLPCIYQGWRKWILRIRRNGIPEMWRWRWLWGKPGCLEGQIGITFTLLSQQVHWHTHTHTQLQDDTHVPSLTGKPGGSFIWTNSRSLLKCLNGATTSSTFSNLDGKKQNFSR